MDELEDLKNQIKAQKKLLKIKEGKFCNLSEKTKLKRELSNLKLKNTYYPVIKTFSTLKKEGKRIGKVIGTGIGKVQKEMYEKDKNGGLGFFN